MPRRQVLATPDADLLAVLKVLEAYKADNPRAEVASYRYNSASIRIRIIDPSFQALDRAERHDLIWGLFEDLTDDTVSQITLLVLLTPEEIKTSMANMDFEDPIPSDF